MNTRTALRGLIFAALVSSRPLAMCETISDDFSAPTIGAQYTIVSGTWALAGTGSAKALSANSTPALMTQTLLGTPSGGFELKSDVLLGGTGSGRYGGLIFNFQNGSNYYVLRFSNVSSSAADVAQLCKVQGGTVSVLQSNSALSLDTSVYYTMAVKRSPAAPSAIEYSISPASAPTLPLFSGTATDSTFMDGLSGFYRMGGATIRYDNYSLSVTDAAGEASWYDDFSGANTAAADASTIPNPLGTFYTIASGTWARGGTTADGISGYLNITGAGVMYRNDRTTYNQGTGRFTISGDVFVGGTGGSRAGGMVCNLQDGNNYYVARYFAGTSGTSNDSSLQFCRVLGGVATPLQSIALNGANRLLPNTYYTVTIRSSPVTGGTKYVYSVANPGSSSFLATGTVTDSSFSNGYGGFYRYGSSTVRCDKAWMTSYEAAGDRELAAKAAAARATSFMRSISTGGGYVWKYALDLSMRAGESACPANIIWFQTPSTPAVGAAFVKAYVATNNPVHLAAAREVNQALTWCQLSSGGWHYSGNMNGTTGAQYNEDGLLDFVGGANPLHTIKSTFDDDTTQNCIRYLVDYVKATAASVDPEDVAARTLLGNAMSGLMNAQYSNGAWPQRWSGTDPSGANQDINAFYPAPGSWPVTRPAGTEQNYSGYYTLNDKAMSQCIWTLLYAHMHLQGLSSWSSSWLDKAIDAGEFLVQAQMPAVNPNPSPNNQVQRGWAQQYTFDMIPAWARDFECPGVTSFETRTALEALMNLWLCTQDDSWKTPIQPAVDWLNTHTIGTNLWSRYYEINSNAPIWVSSGTIRYDIAAAGSYYKDDFDIPSVIGKWNVLKTKSLAWRNDYWADLFGPSPTLSATELAALEGRVDKAIAGLDAEGRWIINSTIPGGGSTIRRIIDTDTFIDNMRDITAYIDQ